MKPLSTITVSDEGRDAIDRMGFSHQMDGIYEIIGGYFSGIAEIEVDAYVESDGDSGEPRIVMELATTLDRAAFRSAVTRFFQRLRDDGNRIHLYLSVVRR